MRSLRPCDIDLISIDRFYGSSLAKFFLLDTAVGDRKNIRVNLGIQGMIIEGDK